MSRNWGGRAPTSGNIHYQPAMSGITFATSAVPKIVIKATVSSSSALPRVQLTPVQELAMSGFLSPICDSIRIIAIAAKPWDAQEVSPARPASVDTR